jgi:hypothetical protein
MFHKLEMKIARNGTNKKETKKEWNNEMTEPTAKKPVPYFKLRGYFSRLSFIAVNVEGKKGKQQLI